MAVVRPNQFTVVEDKETEYTRPTSQEVMRKLAQNINMLRALSPYAEVRAMLPNKPGTPALTSSWQFCDGGEITHPSSPLNSGGSQFTIDMVNRYLAGGAFILDTSDENQGSSTANFSHTHIVEERLAPSLNLEDGEDKFSEKGEHTHIIPTQSLVVNLDLAHMLAAFYMRIFR